MFFFIPMLHIRLLGVNKNFLLTYLLSTRNFKCLASPIPRGQNLDKKIMPQPFRRYDIAGIEIENRTCDRDHATLRGDMSSVNLHVIQYAKSDDFSFSRSRDMVVARQNLNGLRDLSTFLSGIVCHPWDSTTSTINTCTKFEVSIYAHYEDIQGCTKYQKLDGLGVIKGHSRSLEIAPFNRAHRSSCSHSTDIRQNIHMYRANKASRREMSKSARVAPRFWRWRQVRERRGRKIFDPQH